MSQITPELKLTFLEGVSPRHYGIHISIENHTNPLELNASLATLKQTGENTHELIVDTVENSNGSSEAIVDLGQLDIHPTEGVINVKLEMSGQIVGDKKVRTEEAQQELRPPGF